MTSETKTKIFEGEIFNLSATAEKIEKIQKRTAAKGLEGGYTYTVEKRLVPNWHGFNEEQYFLVVEGSAPKLNGWTLVAKVTWEGEAPIVDTVPGYNGPMVDRSTLDGHCDICGYDRNRNHVIVCESETEGRKVVGGQCVKDLLGHDLNGTLWPDLSEFEEDGPSGGWGGPQSVNTQQVVCAAIAATTVWGWVAKSAEWGTPTASYVEKEIVGVGWVNEAARNSKNYEFAAELTKAAEIAYTDQTKQTAAEVIEWAKNLPATSEFNQNLAAVASQEFVDESRIGILAYAFTGWLRAQEREAQKKAEAAKVVNEALGDPKTKVKDLPATITGVSYVEGFYGTSTVVKFLTDSGHKAVWFASNTEIDQGWIGEKVLVSGTIKKSGEWQGVIETALTRCKVTKVAA